MNLKVWIGRVFQESHIFEYGPPECCEQVYPRHAKFCMVCGEAVTTAPDWGLRPQWESLSGLLAPILPRGDHYPTEQAWLDSHISAQWVLGGTDHSLVVGVAMGGCGNAYGEKGQDRVLMSTYDEDAGRFKWHFKTVNRWFRRQFPDQAHSYRAGWITWASNAVEFADVECLDCGFPFRKSNDGNQHKRCINCCPGCVGMGTCPT